MGIVGTLSAIGMAVGPSLIYADQAYSMVRKKDATGFSHDVCGIIIVANTTRIFFWLGNRFETPLLVQSLLLIISMLALLAICLHYAPVDSSTVQSQTYSALSPLNEHGPEDDDDDDDDDDDQAAIMGAGREAESAFVQRPPVPTKNPQVSVFGGARRPFDFWQWETLGTYLEFLAGYIVFLGILQVILGRWMWYTDALGFIALTIESTLPIPQLISNFRRKSCYGFRTSALLGWFGGDTYKTVYFFLRHSPLQFKVTAIMTLCWDTAVACQRLYYGSKPRPEDVAHEERESQHLRVGST